MILNDDNDVDALIQVYAERMGRGRAADYQVILEKLL